MSWRNEEAAFVYEVGGRGDTVEVSYLGDDGEAHRCEVVDTTAS